MTLVHTAGTKLFISASPLSPTPVWTEVGEIANYGAFGRVYQEIKVDSIGERGTRKLKGTYDDGNIALQLNRDPQDAGQALLITARDSDDDYSFKIELNDQRAGMTTPTRITFSAQVLSYTLNPQGPNNVVAAECTISIQSGTIDEVPAA